MSFGRMGARGVVNEGITPEFISRISKAAVNHLDTDRVAIGRDTRLTGEMLMKAATVGVIHAGVDAVQLDVVPTPSIQRYANRKGVPALQITASHNPPEYNGIKLIGDDGKVLNRAKIEEIKEASAHGEMPDASWDSVGEVRRDAEANAEYVDGILTEVDGEAIAEREPLVVVDPGNGAGAETSAALFRELGCQVKTIHAQADGHFPGRSPEPKRETLGDLAAVVTAVDADLGVAHDGDADRVLLVDETGALVDGNTLLSAIASETVKRDDVVVTACNTSQGLIDAVETAGGSVELTPIGNSYILDRIVELRDRGETVPLAGEGNGGVIFPNHRLGRDGAYAAARFLEMIGGRSVSSFVEPFREYQFDKVSVPYASSDEKERMLTRAQEWAKRSAGSVSELDGVRVDFENKWALVRPSGTEPYVRVYAEAGSHSEVQRLITEVQETISER